LNNLNSLIQETKFENADLETIVKESDGAIFNNAGQTLNHNLYFLQFSPHGGGQPLMYGNMPIILIIRIAAPTT